MKAIVVEEYGNVDQLKARNVSRPGKPQGYDILIRVKACSVNPVDVKLRGGIYDDYFDYYDRVPRPCQIIGYDGAGIIEEIGPDAGGSLNVGDEIYYSGSPIRHGSNAEYQLVDVRSVAKKPNNLDFVQAAAMP
ncbi:hypothetical protein MMC14_004264 [Varicellaria rhodocarpa]|nr:hypothetical protein [Varicellaria rhodocarpa]